MPLPQEMNMMNLKPMRHGWKDSCFPELKNLKIKFKLNTLIALRAATLEANHGRIARLVEVSGNTSIKTKGFVFQMLKKL